MRPAQGIPSHQVRNTAAVTVGLYHANHIAASQARAAVHPASSRGMPALALIAACWLGVAPQAAAGEARAQFGVSAMVLPVARLHLDAEPGDLQLTGADLKRGFVDVAQPTSIVVNSNSADGVALDLTNLNPLLTGMVVDGVDSAQVLGGDGGTLVRRWNKPQVLRLTLKFRLMLAPGLTPGRYPWPLRLGVRPL